jgi:hypothetical protein
MEWFVVTCLPFGILKLESPLNRFAPTVGWALGSAPINKHY